MLLRRVALRSCAAGVAAVALCHGGASAQGGGIRAPSTVSQGGTIDVEVGTNDASVEVNAGGPESWSYPVPPGRKVSIPVPTVPGGTVLLIRVGRGLRASVILVEVISP
ncbi:MAG: hypothetical protein ABIP94_19520 [Planctomycetota bacterium]